MSGLATLSMRAMLNEQQVVYITYKNDVRDYF